jgi:hypothetical protein
MTTESVRSSAAPFGFKLYLYRAALTHPSPDAPNVPQRTCSRSLPSLLFPRFFCRSQPRRRPSTLHLPRCRFPCHLSLALRHVVSYRYTPTAPPAATSRCRQRARARARAHHHRPRCRHRLAAAALRPAPVPAPAVAAAAPQGQYWHRHASPHPTAAAAAPQPHRNQRPSHPITVTAAGARRDFL